MYKSHFPLASKCTVVAEIFQNTVMKYRLIYKVSYLVP